MATISTEPLLQEDIRKLTERLLAEELGPVPAGWQSPTQPLGMKSAGAWIGSTYSLQLQGIKVQVGQEEKYWPSAVPLKVAASFGLTVCLGCMQGWGRAEESRPILVLEKISDLLASGKERAIGLSSLLPEQSGTGQIIDTVQGQVGRIRGELQAKADTTLPREIPIVHEPIVLTEEAAEILERILENPDSPVGRAKRRRPRMIDGDTPDRV